MPVGSKMSCGMNFGNSPHFDLSLSSQVPLSTGDWLHVLAWATPILLVDEILKAVGRYIYREDRKTLQVEASTP
jgi:hypothetical protein